ncbi:HAMP domain-containing sensor histidine kinase [Ectothiorhodospira sp. 9100]|uniref:sensor histidine kinase n=1 Tax=unclassified Ectothiorhodospira TaxID=2684909 RepID=UPI001EE96104|nr:HAMP domain-containing histidine kinase [Ectothiorhodospira sp. 9100]MCG5519164.1 HAMP domain-containing histidine kinase [Ectothiorhodospira sp. 9905]
MSRLDFSAVLAISIHDMKNSLNMVLNSLDALLENHSGDSMQCDPARLTQLRYEARRVNDTLIQLLTLYRNDTGGFTPRFAPVMIQELLEDYWLSNKPLMDHRGVSCQLHCDPDLIWVMDRGLVSSLLENVINNTIRYTQDRLSISARQEWGWLVLQVDDNGPGYPEAMLGGRSLEDQGDFDPTEGRTGLGLYFCALVADMHADETRRGYVELSNRGNLGGGCFTLRLPEVLT